MAPFFCKSSLPLRAYLCVLTRPDTTVSDPSPLLVESLTKKGKTGCFCPQDVSEVNARGPIMLHKLRVLYSPYPSVSASQVLLSCICAHVCGTV